MHAVSNQTMRWAVVALTITIVGTAHALAPAPTKDPLTSALELCGDTPAPTKYNGRFDPPTPIEPAPFALAVKSVDDCRQAVIQHFGSAK